MNRFVQGLFLVCLIFIPTSCAKPKIQVALLTKLDSASIIGISEMAAVKEFEQTHPSSPIQVVPFDDGWDPIRTKDAYRVVRDKDIRFLITSHTSTCAVEIADDINQDKRLTIITGATTTKLNGRDDYMLRIIPDANQEQHYIAEKIANLKPKRLLIVRDLSNSDILFPHRKLFYLSSINYYP